MPRRLALIATSLALVVALAGCGSDDDSADERDTTTTTEEGSSTTEADETTTEPETEDPTTPEEPTTEATEPTDTTEAPTDTTPFEVPEGADFCAAYAAFDESFEQLPSDSLEDIQAGAVLLRDAIGQLAPLAPEELADEMALLVQLTEDLDSAAASATTLEEAQTTLQELFSNPEFSGAGETVDTYFGETCPQANDDQAEGDAGSPETVTPG